MIAQCTKSRASVLRGPEAGSRGRSVVATGPRSESEDRAGPRATLAGRGDILPQRPRTGTVRAGLPRTRPVDGH